MAFIALNAFGGGYYAMAGAENVPTEWLTESPFKTYFIPGLFLFIVVGGVCAAGSIASFLNLKHSRLLSFICAGVLVSWIVIQVSIIGYVSWMQPAIFFSALSIAVITWFLPELK